MKINLTELSTTFAAYLSCVKSGNTEWRDRHEETIKEILKDLPYGSGLDAGVEFDMEKSTPQKLIFQTSFHHMNDNGYYDSWTDHTLTFTPTFGGFDLKISGKNHRDIKSYLSDMFYDLMTAEKHTHEIKLSRAFSRQLLQDIGMDKLKQVVELNKDETHKDVCHSHDFCDSNMSMVAAFETLYKREFDLQSESDQELFNNAWTIAKHSQFYIHE